MAYMSYCRFEGTYQEIRNCISDVEEHIEGTAEYPVSDDEIRYFQLMIDEVVDFLYNNEILTDEGEIDDNKMRSVCNAMRQKCDTSRDINYIYEPEVEEY